MNKSISVYIHNIILWMLVIGYYFIITSFSITPANESKAESQAVVDLVEKVSDVVLHKKEADSNSWLTGRVFHSIVRKIAHIMNFFILAFLHGMLFFSYSRKIRHTTLFILIMGFCCAAIDEITQLFVEGRSGQLSDVFVDFSGTIMGCILFVFLYKVSISKLKRG